MFRYFYETENMECVGLFPSLGRAIDAALFDFPSGISHPIKIQDANDRDIFDVHDLHWMYARSWNVEYDRATGAVTPRGVADGIE